MGRYMKGYQSYISYFKNVIFQITKQKKYIFTTKLKKQTFIVKKKKKKGNGIK